MLKLWRFEARLPERAGDLAFGFVTAAFGAALFVAALQIPTSRLSDPIGSRAFPVLIAVSIFICGIFLFGSALSGGKRAILDGESNGGDINVAVAPIFFVLLLMLAYFWVFRRAGFLLSCFAFVMTFLAVFHPRRPLVNLAVAVLFPLVIYFGFTRLLGLRLAPGILPF